MEDWCILRTKARSTMGLAASLAKDGFEVWTPVETKMARVPRLNIRREVRQAIMPSYVFARARHLVDLLQLAAMPVKPRRGAGLLEPAHAGFSVMRCGDKIPVVADRHLEALRDSEKMAVPRKRGPAYAKGQMVRVVKGSFQGLGGMVERGDAREVHVWLSLFGRQFRTKIPAFLLEADGLCKEPIAARRAA